MPLQKLHPLQPCVPPWRGTDECIEESDLRSFQELILMTVNSQFAQKDREVALLTEQLNTLRIIVEQDHVEFVDRFDTVSQQLEQKAESASMQLQLRALRVVMEHNQAKSEVAQKPGSKPEHASESKPATASEGMACELRHEAEAAGTMDERLGAMEARLQRKYAECCERLDSISQDARLRVQSLQTVELDMQSKVSMSTLTDHLNSINQELQRNAEAVVEVVAEKVNSMEERLKRECLEMAERMDSVHQLLHQKADTTNVRSELHSLQAMLQCRADTVDMSIADIIERLSGASAHSDRTPDPSDMRERVDRLEQTLHQKTAELVERYRGVEKQLHQEAAHVHVGLQPGEVQQNKQRKTDMAQFQPVTGGANTDSASKLTRLHQPQKDDYVDIKERYGGFDPQVEQKANTDEMNARISIIDRHLQHKVDAVDMSLTDLEQQLQKKADVAGVGAQIAGVERCLAQKADLSELSKLNSTLGALSEKLDVAITTARASSNPLAFVQQVGAAQKTLIDEVERFNVNLSGSHDTIGHDKAPPSGMLTKIGSENRSSAVIQQGPTLLRDAGAGKAMLSRDRGDGQHSSASVGRAHRLPHKSGGLFEAGGECAAVSCEPKGKEDDPIVGAAPRRFRAHGSAPPDADSCSAACKAEPRIWGPKNGHTKRSQSPAKVRAAKRIQSPARAPDVARRAKSPARSTSLAQRALSPGVASDSSRREHSPAEASATTLCAQVPVVATCVAVSQFSPKRRTCSQHECSHQDG